MTMTLEQLRDWHRNRADALDNLMDKERHTGDDAREASMHRAMADAIDAHLTQPAQACEHDWAVGYGVPAYCNHCGVERDPKPAQSVDIEAIREVIVWLRSGSMAITANAGIAADKLEAALP